MSKRRLPQEPPSSEITPRELYQRRRDFLKKSGLFVATSTVWGASLSLLSSRGQADPPEPPPMPKTVAWKAIRPGPYGTGEPRTAYEHITTYNNYYELGLSKSDPARNADTLRPKPWAVRILGEVEKELTIDVDTLVGWFGLEERVYRMRCVEAWSMVIPWLGFALRDLIRRVQPTSRAKFVEMTTLYDPEQLPGQNDAVLPWPYVEALRMDEALNELTFLALGLYGSPLPGQNGAPIRLVVPWKYGFKGAKSLVSIRFTETQPVTTWNRAAPNEYGFYANVNPSVDHPRWSQATERRIGETERRDTLLFNGYADQVASLYSELNLTRFF